MINILVHGLGQNEKSWNEVKNQLNNKGINVETPKTIFTIQNIIYKFMPKRIFEQIGCPKKDMIRLLDSMKNLSIPEKAPNIKGDTLIICGEKEKR